MGNHRGPWRQTHRGRIGVGLEPLRRDFARGNKGIDAMMRNLTLPIQDGQDTG